MQLTGQKHGGQVLLADSVGPLRWLNRWGCVFCGNRSGVAGATSTGATLLSANFAFGIPSRKDDSPVIRMQRPAVRQPVSSSPRARSQYLQENLWTTARFQTVPSGTSL